MLDTKIINAEIADGSGKAVYRADVGLLDGRIAAIGTLKETEARESIDAAGRTLTPGFIDIHRHADAALFRPEFGEAELFQGLTTVINGNCGLSAAPVGGPFAEDTCRYLSPITGVLPKELRFSDLNGYLRSAQAQRLPLHAGMLVGMGTLRAGCAGFGEGPLTGQQLRAIQKKLEESLGDGAMGVSLGLGYAPESFSTPEELLRLLEPLRGSGTVVSVHMRQEGDGVEEALEEMLHLARALRIPVEISHLKAIGRRNWRSAVPRMLRAIADARAEGADVTCDVYPYPAGSTQLIHVLPPEFHSGGTAALTARLRDPDTRAAIRRRMETGQDFENITLLVGFENVRATNLQTPEYAPFEGCSLAEVAAAQGKDPFDALFDLLAAGDCAPGMIDFITDDEDIAEILRSDFSCAISDAIYPTSGLVHPRVYGMTAHLLEHFVREKAVLTLPEAVNRLTLRPAERYGLASKGRIAVGADADLCLFDPARIRETATYTDPRQTVQGMDYVFVGGQAALAEGRLTGVRGGEVLRRS